jgi:hypothetical protein
VGLGGSVMRSQVEQGLIFMAHALERPSEIVAS